MGNAGFCPSTVSPGLQDLNIFNFFYVDENVAVAQGRAYREPLPGPQK